jgi:hypothetical protein
MLGCSPELSLTTISFPQQNPKARKLVGFMEQTRLLTYAVNGMHLNAVAKAKHRMHLRQTSELRWRASGTNRMRIRRQQFRMSDNPPYTTRNPDDERREFMSRLIASDSAAGRARNAAELSHELAPDRPGDNYNIYSLLTHRGDLKYDPKQMTEYEVKNKARGYRWPAWKVLTSLVSFLSLPQLLHTASSFASSFVSAMV